MSYSPKYKSDSTFPSDSMENVSVVQIDFTQPDFTFLIHGSA